MSGAGAWPEFSRAVPASGGGASQRAVPGAGLDGAVGVLGACPSPGTGLHGAVLGAGAWRPPGGGAVQFSGRYSGAWRSPGAGFPLRPARAACWSPRRAFQKPRGRAPEARLLRALPAEPLLLRGQSRRVSRHFSRDPGPARRLFAPRRPAGGVAMVHFLHASQSPRVIIPPDAQKDALGRIVVQVSPERAGAARRRSPGGAQTPTPGRAPSQEALADWPGAAEWSRAQGSSPAPLVTLGDPCSGPRGPPVVLASWCKCRLTPDS